MDLNALEAGVNEGRFALTDLVQAGNVPLWQPLAKILDHGEGDMRGVIAPGWKCILKLAGIRARHNIVEQSLGTGTVCLAFAILFAVLSKYPFVFWAPWLAATGAAGVVLIRRRREIQGTLLLMAVVGLPFAYAILGSKYGSHGAAMAAEPQGQLPVAAQSSVPLPSSDAAIPAELAPPGAVAVETLAPASGPAIGQTAEATLAMAKDPDPSWRLPEFPPLPPVSTAASASAANGESGDLVQQHIDAFVIVKGQEGSGSGFVCRAGDRTFLFTNIHVAADLKQPVFTRLDNVPIIPGTAEAAAGPDIVRYALAQPPAHPLEMMTDVDGNVRIGDEVVVLGNSGGGGVVTNLKGDVRGLGPDRIEVSAEFIPGNSGSPIIHVKSGKVIGIATYLTRRYEEFAAKPQDKNPPSSSSGSSSPAPVKPAMVVRRFGYRIDNVARWEPVNWAAFRAEGTQVQDVSRLTGDIVNFLNALRNGKAPQYATDTLRRPASDWILRIGDKHLSESDRMSATQRFLGSLRAMARGDTYGMEGRLHYTYFRNEMKDEQQARDQRYEIFDKESASLAMQSGVHSARGAKRTFSPPVVN